MTATDAPDYLTIAQAARLLHRKCYPSSRRSSRVSFAPRDRRTKGRG